MKKSNLFKTLVTGLTICSISAIAQDKNTDSHAIDIKIPEVALLDIEAKSTTISMEGTSPTEAGNALTFSEKPNTDLWLNYSSIIGNKETSRDVTVAVTKGEIPAGLKVLVTASKDAGKGKGTLGSPSNELTLSGSAQKIITGVGSCYTGNGIENGHNLSYVIKVDDESYGKLNYDNSGSIEVTYTLTDN